MILGIWANKVSKNIVSTEKVKFSIAPEGALSFLQEKNKIQVVEKHGDFKYQKMIRDLSNPRKIKLTHDTVLPSFLNQSIEAIVNAMVNV